MSLASLNLIPQPPLPFEAAVEYERTVLEWAAASSFERAVRDRPYGRHPRHIYDAYYPARPEGAPVVVFWHGGGWTNGYKEYCHFMAPHIAAMGAILVLPNYRLAPEDGFPAAIDDCAILLDELASDTSFPGDPAALHLSGHSAGGQLAALATLRLPGGDRGWSVRSCVPISGIMELGNDAPPGSFDARIYDMVLPSRDVDVVYSPICWTPGNRTPFVLRYGEDDSPRVKRSNRRLAALLALQPGASACHEEIGRDHFSMHLQLHDPASPWYDDLARLLGSRA